VISSIPSSTVNVVAPYAPQGRLPVSQETNDLKSSTFKATEQPAESSRGLNRRLPDERPNDEAEQDRIYSGRASGSLDDQDAKQKVQQERQEAELKQIQELAARDREVRAHEQAHAAIAGSYGGSPTYTFVRGPDGVSYAVGGEVSIDTSPIPGDPEATIRKAQQLRRAANAPADPSGQDRQVAAQATQMEQEARAELREQQAIESTQQERTQGERRVEQKAESEPVESVQRDQERREQEEEKLQREQQRFEEEQRLLDQRRARAELFGQMGQRNIDINRRLVEIGVFESASSRGSFLNKTV